jgi:hypothetical protein
MEFRHQARIRSRRERSTPRLWCDRFPQAEAKIADNQLLWKRVTLTKDLAPLAKVIGVV